MSALTFIDPQPASSVVLDAFEERHGLRLPAQFRRLLEGQSNGGEIKPVASRSHPSVGFSAVLGVARDDAFDLGTRAAEYGPDRLSPGLIPIADAEGGNLVCLSCRPYDFGSVWFWDHELEIGGNSLIHLDGHLDAFLGDLVPVAERAEPQVVLEKWIDLEFLEGLEQETES